MAWFDDNCRALERAQPGFVVPPTGDGVRHTAGVWRLYDSGRSIALHSRDGCREGDRDAAALLDGNPDAPVLVVIGLGLGFVLDGLERQGWRGTVVAIEPEPETVAPLLERRDWRPWIAAGRLHLLVAPDFRGAPECSICLANGAGALPTLVNPALAQARQVAVARALALLDRLQSEARANAEARQAYAGPYLRHTLGNLQAIASEADAGALQDAAPGVSAVLVAAGPSLDDALPALAQIQRSSLIIAVDTACAALLHAGIQPHLVVSVDPSEDNARHLTDLPPSPETWLVAEGSLDPLAVRPFAGRTFFFRVADHHPWPWLRSLGSDVVRLRAWGSVLTTAFDLALRMGCDPIAFVGADLAFTGDRPYARGVTYEHEWRRRLLAGEPLERQWAESIARWPAAIAPDLSGRDVRTAPHLVAFRDWLVEQMRREPGRRFINATGAGILHGAGEQVAPEALADLLSPATADLRGLLRSRHARPGAPVAGDLQVSRRTAMLDVSESVFDEWHAFAPAVPRDEILATLRRAVDPPEPANVQSPLAMGSDPPLGPAYVFADADALSPIARHLELVPMVIPPQRIERAYSGARRFCCRTTAARIILHTVRPPDGAVREDGRPLARATDCDHVEPGSYLMAGDEVHFRASDDTDPRTNGREYTLLVPAAVEYLETLPAGEILRRDL